MIVRIRTLWFAMCVVVTAITVHASPHQAGPKLEAVSGERFAEDWSHMADPSARSRPWHRLKWITLGRNSHLSVGGDVKWRSEYIDSPYFGANGEESDFYVLQRFMAHADLRLNPNIREFTQLGFHKSFGRKADFPFDDDRADVQQSFIELTQGTSERGSGIRPGRQEIVLFPRFVTPRGALNIRAAFDGVRGWVARGPFLLDAFATRPVINNAGSFDDRSDDNQRFDALRLIYSFGGSTQWNVTGSVHRIDREFATVGPYSGRDDRVSWSIRLRGIEGAWDFDAEHYLQTGDFADQTIDAFGGGGDIGHTWRNAAWRPRLGIRWLYGSGDPDATDDEINTFFGPQARPPCCEDALWLAPSNMVALTSVFGLKPSSKFSIDFKVDFIRILDETDGVYEAGRVAYAESLRRSSSDRLSISTGFGLTWSPSDVITNRGYFVSQSAEGVLADIDGSDSTFSVLAAHFRF